MNERNPNQSKKPNYNRRRTVAGLLLGGLSVMGIKGGIMGIDSLTGGVNGQPSQADVAKLPEQPVQIVATNEQGPSSLIGAIDKAEGEHNITPTEGQVAAAETRLEDESQANGGTGGTTTVYPGEVLNVPVYTSKTGFKPDSATSANHPNPPVNTNQQG